MQDENPHKTQGQDVPAGQSRYNPIGKNGKPREYFNDTNADIYFDHKTSAYDGDKEGV